MKVMIATGISALDSKLEEALKALSYETEIAGYREYLEKNYRDITVISEFLPGLTDLFELIYKIRKSEKRVVLLLDNPNNPLTQKALSSGIYDILFDEGDVQKGIDVPNIINVIKYPKKLADFDRIYKIPDAPATINNENESKGVEATPQTPKAEREIEIRKEVEFKFIEKEKVTTKREAVKELDSAVIAIISASENGKSLIATNIAPCFSERNYTTTLLNVDDGYSANIYYNIIHKYYAMLEHAFKTNAHSEVLDVCYKRKKLNVVTGELGCLNDIPVNDFNKLLNSIRARSSIVIVDTKTGLNDITLEAVRQSTICMMVFDSDLMRFHKNLLMLDQLGEDFVPEKTIAIINNSDTNSESYKFIYKQLLNIRRNKETKRIFIEDLDIDTKGFSTITFRDIINICNCKTLNTDAMNTDKTAYDLAEDKLTAFREDIDALLNVINTREKEKSFFQKLFKK